MLVEFKVSRYIPVTTIAAFLLSHVPQGYYISILTTIYKSGINKMETKRRQRRRFSIQNFTYTQTGQKWGIPADVDTEYGSWNTTCHPQSENRLQCNYWTHMLKADCESLLSEKIQKKVIQK